MSEPRPQTTETVTISRVEYRELRAATRKLRALEAGGVDNWEWYDASIEDAGGPWDDDEPEEDTPDPRTKT